jgi:hypothetical protein
MGNYSSSSDSSEILKQPELAKQIRDLLELGPALSTLGELKTIGGLPYIARISRRDEVDTQTYEHLLANPLRRRALVEVDDADSFIAYILRYQTAPSKSQEVVFAQIGETGATFTAVLDYHDIDLIPQPLAQALAESSDTPSPVATESEPLGLSEVDRGKANWGKHRVVYACKETPEWKRWMGSNGKRMSQADFAEFLEDNGADVNPNWRSETPNGSPSMADMIEISRNLSATSTGDFSQSFRLANGQVQFKWSETISGTSQTSQGVIEIPEKFIIGIAPFVGFDGCEIYCRLKYRLQNGKLTMWYEMERPHKVVEMAGKQVLERILSETGLKPFRGKVSSMGV